MNCAQSFGDSLLSSGVQFAVSSTATSILLSISDKNRAGTIGGQTSCSVAPCHLCSNCKGPPVLDRAHKRRTGHPTQDRTWTGTDIPHRHALCSPPDQYQRLIPAGRPRSRAQGAGSLRFLRGPGHPGLDLMTSPTPPAYRSSEHFRSGVYYTITKETGSGAVRSSPTVPCL